MAEQMGGGGGMDWAALGDAIQQNSMQVLNDVMALVNKQRDRDLEEEKLLTQKKQFKRSSEQTDRGQNLQSLNFLQGKIDNATERARRSGGGLTFDNALSKAMRMG